MRCRPECHWNRRRWVVGHQESYPHSLDDGTGCEFVESGHQDQKFVAIPTSREVLRPQIRPQNVGNLLKNGITCGASRCIVSEPELIYVHRHQGKRLWRLGRQPISQPPFEFRALGNPVSRSVR